jgi:methanogenic corrinoid protein MtbC1
MSGAPNFDRQMLAVAFSEIDAARQNLPESALAALAQEVVQRVAQNLTLVPPQGAAFTDRDVNAFCVALVSDDPNAAATLIEEVQRRGVSYDAICLSYVAAAARQMGEWWDNDKISFYSVTVGAGRLYAILRILRLHRPASVPDMRRFAVFASVPGENHTLGITMAADLARTRGWDIDLLVGLSHDDLLAELATRKPALIGLSASGKRSMPALTQLIVAQRIASSDTRIVVCGQIAKVAVNLVGVTGADAAALDFETAYAQMERLIAVPSGQIH